MYEYDVGILIPQLFIPTHYAVRLQALFPLVFFFVRIIVCADSDCSPVCTLQVYVQYTYMPIYTHIAYILYTYMPLQM